MAELVSETSPYRFANNNPNFWSDPTGLSDEIAFSMTGSEVSAFFGGNAGAGRGLMGFSMPAFFSWGNAQNEGIGIPPLPSFLGIAAYLPYDMTKVTIQIDPVIVEYEKKKTKESDELDINPWGPTLIGLGQPWIPKDSRIIKKIFGHGFKSGMHKNTSVASIVLRKSAPQKINKIVGKTAGNWIAKQAGTKTVGGILGRTLPGVGWGVTAYDITTEIIIPMSEGAALYHKSNENSGNWINNLPH